MPVMITPMALAPAIRAAERNSTSTDGRWRETSGPSLHRDVIARAAALQQHVLVAGRDQHLAAQHRIAVLGFLDLDLAQAVEPLGEGGGEFLRHVLDDDDAGRIGRQRLQHFAQRLGAAGRGADADDHLGGLGHGPAASAAAARHRQSALPRAAERGAARWRAADADPGLGGAP